MNYKLLSALFPFLIHAAAACASCGEITIRQNSPGRTNNELVRLWEGNGLYRHVSIKTLTPVYEKNDFTHEFSLTLVQPRGTEWTDTEIAGQILAAAKAYGQCDIRIKSAVVVSADVPIGLLELRNVIPAGFTIGDDKTEVELASAIPDNWPKPVVFFLNGHEKAWAYTDEAMKALGAISASNGLEFVEPAAFVSLENTAFISSSFGKASNALPHELGHIFDYEYKAGASSDIIHSHDDFDNLMNFDPDHVNGHVASYMCDIFRASPLLRQVVR
ncbi:MAG: hypothetical protein WCW52_00325 [Elusimicrobiales bacterium]|jgi:hypothetical protein